MKDKLSQNTENAIAFYKIAFYGDPGQATRLYVGDDYRQHNPTVKDGIQGFVEYFNRMHSEYPEKSVEFVRSVAENDLVTLHTHQVWPGNEEYVTMDIFRFDKAGKIVEHWDAIQKIPVYSENRNTMY
jgi:predicted SnoaL-like aldol condensation-catalyzing enzyme